MNLECPNSVRTVYTVYESVLSVLYTLRSYGTAKYVPGNDPKPHELPWFLNHHKPRSSRSYGVGLHDPSHVVAILVFQLKKDRDII